ncbi:hypothetical protein N9F40_01230 [bacterium]|nr:hypothetical protein [bacterium]
MFEQFAKSWGFMVSNFMLKTVYVIGTTRGKISISGELIINIDGKLGKAHLIDNNIAFVLTVVEGKVTSWDGLWDNEYAPMLEARSLTTLEHVLIWNVLSTLHSTLLTFFQGISTSGIRLCL